jgi:hypothetical protein
VNVDDDLDQMIRETQHRHADRITSSGDPVPEIFSRVQRTRRKRRAVTTLAVVAIGTAGVIGAVAGGTQLLGGDDTTGHNVATASPTPNHTSPTTSFSTPAPEGPKPLEDALRTQLTANPAVRYALLGYENPTETVLCSTHVFGSDPSHEHLYIWVSCATYGTGPNATEISGGGDPALLTVKGSGADTQVVAVQFPRIAHYNEDIAAMFPAPIVAEIGRREFQTVPTASQLLAEARQRGKN